MSVWLLSLSKEGTSGPSGGHGDGDGGGGEGGGKKAIPIWCFVSWVPRLTILPKYKRKLVGVA